MESLLHLLGVDNLNQLYPLFAKISAERCAEVLVEVHPLFESAQLKKDLVYLSLLVNPDKRALDVFLEHDRRLSLDVRNASTLFNECHYEWQNWFEQVFDVDFDLRRFDIELRRSIWTTRLIGCTNTDAIDVKCIQKCLEELEDVDNDEFLWVYVEEVRYILTVLEFIGNDSAELFYKVSCASLLGVFKDHLDLSETSKWGAIGEQLKAGELRKGLFEYNSELGGSASDHELFKAYTILHSVIRSVHLCSNNEHAEDITAIVDRSESDLLALGNSALQLQLLEDVFAVCFMRQDNIFALNFQQLRLLLCFLKSCLRKLRLKNDPRLKNLNVYVSDAFWRLEMLSEVGYATREDFMRRMLAPPTSLIRMCLKNGRFDKADEVIEIFNLHGSETAKEIVITRALLDFRAVLSKTFRMRDYQKRTPQISTSLPDLTVRKQYISFFANKDRLVETNDALDIALTLPCGHSDSAELLELAKDAKCDFYDRAFALFTEICAPNEVDLCTVLSDSTYLLDTDLHIARNAFYASLSSGVELFKKQLANKPNGTINAKHVAHGTYLKLHELVPSENKYLLRLFNYLKSLLQFFYVEGNRSDLVTRGKSVSYFELLAHSRNEMFRRLVFDENSDPQDFEPLSSKLKIDLLYHVSANCFPRIEFVPGGNGRAGTTLRPSRRVFTYIQRRNWLLAYIVSAVFELDESDVRFNENRTRYFVQFATSHEINRLKLLFNGNPTVACLHSDFVDRCVEHVNRNVFSGTDDRTDGLDAAEEISEGDYRCNWRYLLELLDAVPERQTRDHPAFEKIRDRVLSNLVLDDFESEHYKYVRLIRNDDVRMGLLLEHSTSWPGEFCLSLLKSELTKENKWRDVLTDWLKTVSFCEEVRLLFDYKIWSEVHELCCENPEAVMSQLLLKPKVHLFLNFAELYSSEHLLTTSITYDSIHQLFSRNPRLDDIERLFARLPESDVIGIGVALLASLRDLDHLRFVADHLGKLTPTIEGGYLRNVQISLEILECFTPNERDQFRPLINSPLEIVEMLLMNTKLDRLGIVMEKIRPVLLHYEFSDICLERVDELLKRFARKSLEFRGILQPHPKLLQAVDNKLLQSLDSLYGPDRKYFVMPATIPDKGDWVPNNEVVECMCCQNTTFSMFNRRHHCRRCGRVVCFNCSTKRMHVSTYGDIMVRVCIDCYDQSHADGNVSMSDNASAKSIMYDYWFLTDDPDHNRIVRQEFSYEHAPSVSLCLSIMKFHSKNDNYPKFLLEQCDYLLTLLQPVSPTGSPEIDYSLIIRMLKSLAIAAKMVSSECQPHWGASQADRILSQADLLGLLVERGCLNLLATSSTQSGAPFVDARILRKLRDKLLENEQFNFALDVSTKAGLDNAGVFAAWGKSYLKAGCLQAAREKFQRCLEKNTYYEVSSEHSLDESVPDDTRKRTLSKMSTTSETKPTKNPPLLMQIVQILESQTAKLDKHLKSELAKNRSKNSNLSLNKLLLQHNDMAICIRRKLTSLRSIASANYEHDDVTDGKLDPIFFDECVYYLQKYGTHLSLLQFYVRHNRIAIALRYIVDNRVPADVFVEVYTACLKDGKVALLQETMTAIDSTLETWKDYLKQICRYLEKQNLLHSLYQLQQFMGDYIRAAMTCIRFYKCNASTYKELSNNTCHLVKAEEHLRQELEQQQWVEVNTVQKQDVDSKNDFEEKGLTNPSLVLKMDSRDIAKNINTINRQIEVTKFLAKYEREDVSLMSMLPDITASTKDDERESVVRQLPTLFDGQQEKLQLTVLIIMSGDKVDDGYALVDQIIQEHKLKPIKVYCQLGQYFARQGDHKKVEQLVSCIRSNSDNDANVTDMCDRLLALAVRTLYSNNKPVSELETLIKLISDKATKISMYIETKQLKTAYVLALRYSRYGDIRRILKEAEMLNKPDIKKLCQKLLQSHSHSHKE